MILYVSIKVQMSIYFLMHQITQTRPGLSGLSTWRRLGPKRWLQTPSKW